MVTGNKVDDVLWLGYSGLVVDCAAVSALVIYQQAWDRRILQAYGQVPSGVRCIVLLEDGRVLPSQRSIEDLHRQLASWQARRVS